MKIWFPQFFYPNILPILISFAYNSETTLKCRNESLQKMVHLLEADLDRKKASVDELEGKLQGMANFGLRYFNAFD